MLAFDIIQIAYMYVSTFQNVNAGQIMDDMPWKFFFTMVSSPVKFELLDSLKCHITHSSVTNLCLDLFSTFTSTLSQFYLITPYQSLFFPSETVDTIIK